MQIVAKCCGYKFSVSTHPYIERCTCGALFVDWRRPLPKKVRDWLAFQRDYTVGQLVLPGFERYV